MSCTCASPLVSPDPRRRDCNRCGRVIEKIEGPVYLAGPMTGIPQFNFPLFDSVAEDLRRQGIDIRSPAEMDDHETRQAALASPDGAPGSGTTNGETWADFLARDVKLIADGVSAVAALPGWERSKGARLEVFIARLTDKPVLSVILPHDGSRTRLAPMSASQINAGLALS